MVLDLVQGRVCLSRTTLKVYVIILRSSRTNLSFRGVDL